MPQSSYLHNQWPTLSDYGWYTPGDYGRPTQGADGWYTSGDYGWYTPGDHGRPTLGGHAWPIITRSVTLGRDSVLSNPSRLRVPRCHRQVSIPRSGFCLVERGRSADARLYVIVSIPRSGFCLVELSAPGSESASSKVSIPRSGFCLVEPGVLKRSLQAQIRFNPSVGILSCRTMSRTMSGMVERKFQSLGRDSVLSNEVFFIGGIPFVHVSIPRSGFCLVELVCRA